MNRFWLLPALLILISACVTPAQQQETAVKEEAPVASTLPESLQKVLAAHGGLDTWRSMRSLSFTIPKDTDGERHQTDLWTRQDRIEGANFTLGHDGNDVWLVADTTYKGNAVFYHNLMFYFYAMPFVLADDGIVYSDIEPLNFEGKDYPGVKISYESGVGASDQDEYMLYYDPDTYEMAWLAYTATYFSGKKSDKFNHIRYDDWGEFNGIKLPNSMSWFKKEDGKLIEPRSTASFTDIELSQEALDPAIFEMPEGALVVKG